MEQNAKQQAVERLKGATNILVTVSKNPTVDQLAACIGFTLMLNKLGKHATAVFSGTTPSTLEFLQPEKTIEQNTDSLRDFIIALDKSKADKLRYKVEDDVVRIFITPYRTSISDKDLEFSQGDFNVDVVVALGVTNKEDIDQAIVAHGRILHDAVVVSVTNGKQPSDVGSINWHDEMSSSLSEMLVSISESFQSGLLDGQMATAFLTGIVAETERFSNEKTSPKVMTMSAQLMAAGANQQLIATKLAPPPPEPPAAPEPALVNMPVEPYQPPVENEQQQAEAPAPANTSVDGEIEIEHEDEIHIDDQGNLHRQEELEAAAEAEKKKAEAAAATAEVKPQEDLTPDQPEQSEPEATLPVPEPIPAPPQPLEHKMLGDEPTHEEQNNSQDEDSAVLGMAGGDSYLAGSSHKVLQPLSGAGDINPLAAFAPLESKLSDPSDTTATLPPIVDTNPIAETTQLPPLPPAEPEHRIEQPLPAWSKPAEVSALPPQNDTLASLEEAVGSPHVEQTEQNDPVAEARQAVQTASLDSVPRPQASQAVGAQYVEVQPPTVPAVNDVLQQQSSQVVDPMAPPPVPPPMMPQYLNPTQQPPQNPPL